MGRVLWGVLCVALCAALPTKEDELVITTEAGPVKGHFVADGAVVEFLGIPYAAPPTGNLRFASPSPVESWTDLLIADKPSAGCAQNCTIFKAACPATVSEDCLYLNVWAPSQATIRAKQAQRERQHAKAADVADSLLRLNKNSKLSTKSKWQLKSFEDSFLPVNLVQEPTSKVLSTAPVFLFLHGGLFMEGHGASSIYNGTDIAEAGVVVVTINYRLGALGALTLGPELTGNFGFQDQNFAMNWVQRNINAFGGDPNQVTLGGQSAGAISVAMHMTSPASEGLFSQVIMESPVVGLPLLTQDQAGYELGKDFAEKLGCMSSDLSLTWSHTNQNDSAQLAECLRNASLADIVEAQSYAIGQTESVRKVYGSPYFSALLMPWSPVIDGNWIVGQPLSLIQSGEWKKMPVLAGFTRDEFNTFLPVVIPELGRYSYDALIYGYFGLRASGPILEQYPASEEVSDQRTVLAQVVRDMFVACPLRYMTVNNTFPAYLYRFDHILQDSRLWSDYQAYCSDKACHSSELAVVFAGRFAPERSHLTGSLTPVEQEGADTLHNYWVQFIQSSNPNDSKSFPWPQSVGSGPYLVVETPFSLAPEGVNSSRCDLWDRIGYFW